MSDEDATLARARSQVIGWGLAAEPEAPLVLDDATSSRLRLWANETRLEGPLWAAHEAGAAELVDGEASLLRDSHLRSQHLALACEARAAELTELLASNRIEVRVLKGLAAGRLDYPDPALRTFADVDLLVRRRDLLTTLDVLERDGHRMVESSPARWWLARFGRAVTLKRAAGAEVDLHAAIVVGYFGVRLDHDRLFELGHETVPLGGIDVLALAGPARLLASCYATVLSRGPRERLWRDVAHQLVGPRCDWRASVELAASADGEAVLAQAMLEAATATGVAADHPALAWARCVVPSTAAQRALDGAQAGEDHGWRADARSTVMALSPLDRAAFLGGAGLHSVARRFRRAPQR